MKKIKLKLIQALIYYWDVFFTWIDVTQLRMWVRLKEAERSLTAVQHIQPSVEHTEEDIQRQWNDLLQNAEFRGKISIRRCSGRINNGN